MAINYYFFNSVNSDRVYNSEDFCSYLNKLVSNGVLANPSTSLQVRAGSGMQVIVGAGEGWIAGHKMVNTSDMSLTLSAASSTLNRIDSVVFYLDLTNRLMGIIVKSGTATSGTPTAPALTRSSTRYEMRLANIRINKGTTAITNGMITDTRLNTNDCGIVSGLITQIDASTLFQQMQAQFEEWLETVNNQYIESGGAPVPEVKDLTVNSTTIASNTATDVLTVSVPKGLSFITFRGKFSEDTTTSGTGFRRLFLYRTNASINWQNKFNDYMSAVDVTPNPNDPPTTNLHVEGFVYADEATTIYVKVKQNSGTSMTFYGGGELVRFSPEYLIMQ